MCFARWFWRRYSGTVEGSRWLLDCQKVILVSREGGEGRGLGGRLESIGLMVCRNRWYGGSVGRLV